jgi:hypothetical protein
MVHISDISALTALLHQSLMTTSSKRKARSGSLDTALSSKQTSVISGLNVKVTDGKRRHYINNDDETVFNRLKHKYKLLMRIQWQIRETRLF